VRGAESGATGPPEAVDGDADSHDSSSVEVSPRR